MSEHKSDTPPPKVCFLIPSLNHAKFSSATLDSVFASTYPNIHVVVCDDASTDNNLDILKAARDKYGFTLLNNRTRLGVNATLNRCFAACPDADFYYAIATDDVLDPLMVEACLGIMNERPEIDVLLGSHTVIDAAGNRLRSVKVSGSYDGARIKLRSPWEEFHASFQFHRGSFARAAYPLPEDMLGEDHYFFHFAIFNEFNVTQTNIHFLLRRIHGSNASTSRTITESVERAVDRFRSFPQYNEIIRVGLRRQMLCTLPLSPWDRNKRRFASEFIKDGFSLYLALYAASFLPGARIGASIGKWAVRKIRSTGSTSVSS